MTGLWVNSSIHINFLISDKLIDTSIVNPDMVLDTSIGNPNTVLDTSIANPDMVEKCIEIDHSVYYLRKTQKMQYLVISHYGACV